MPTSSFRDSERLRAVVRDLLARVRRRHSSAGSTHGINEASRLPTGVRVTEFDVDNETIFVNVNTPHDYERAKGLIE